MTKSSKSEAHYTPKAAKHDERCALCRHFVDPNGCRLVEGHISPKGWCRYFEMGRT